MDTHISPAAQAVEGSAEVRELWGLDLQTAGCPACKGAFLVEQGWIGKPCPTCGQGTLEPQPAVLRQEPPELMAPFERKYSDLTAIYTQFVQGVWMHTPDFTAESLARRAVPVFWPMWLVDSDVKGGWQAEVGYNYEVKSSQESYSGGSWHTNETLETRVRWEPRLGQIERHYDNIAVPARMDHERMMALLGSYTPSRAVPYEPERASKAGINVPDQHPENAWSLAKDRLNQAAADECQQAAGGQHIRSFGIRAEYSNPKWTQLLLPFFASYYQDDEGKVRMVFVNGQTGAAGGQKVASVKKGWQTAGIIGLIAGVLLLLGLIGLVIGIFFPPLLAVGGVIAALALIVGLAAFIPPAWAGLYNRNQSS